MWISFCRKKAKKQIKPNQIQAYKWHNIQFVSNVRFKLSKKNWQLSSLTKSKFVGLFASQALSNWKLQLYIKIVSKCRLVSVNEWEREMSQLGQLTRYTNIYFNIHTYMYKLDADFFLFYFKLSIVIVF